MVDRIKELRQKIFVSQSNMEDCLNLSRNTLSAYERGKAFFKPHTLQTLSSKYNININWLLTGKGNMLLSDNDNINNNNIINQLQSQVTELQVNNDKLQAQVDLLKDLLQSKK